MEFRFWVECTINESVHSGSYVFIRLRLLRWIPLAHCAGVCATAVSPPELAHCHSTSHSPYSRQVTERMACSVVIHPPPSVYPKVGNGVLGDQQAIKYHCQNDKPTIIFTARDLVHWNVASENIPRVCKSWKSPLIHIFLYIFVHPTLTPLKLNRHQTILHTFSQLFLNLTLSCVPHLCRQLPNGQYLSDVYKMC